MYCHVLTSIVGKHPNKQDAIRYYEDKDIIIAVVADGLGSREKSAQGARLICRLLIEELFEKRPPLLPKDLFSAKNWQDYLTSANCNTNDFCTTCSFAIIDKISKSVCVGQIGDSPIFLNIDSNPVIEIRKEKDFSNITDSLAQLQQNKIFSRKFKLCFYRNLLIYNTCTLSQAFKTRL